MGLLFMSFVSLVASRFSVSKNGVHLGVIVPRSDGWSFVMATAPFRFFYGETPEKAVEAAGYELKEVN